MSNDGDSCCLLFFLLLSFSWERKQLLMAFHLASFSSESWQVLPLLSSFQLHFHCYYCCCYYCCYYYYCCYCCYYCCCCYHCRCHYLHPYSPLLFLVVVVVVVLLLGSHYHCFLLLAVVVVLLPSPPPFLPVLVRLRHLPYQILLPFLLPLPPLLPSALLPLPLPPH
uniref:Wsv094 n=1 Tax=White spot syndrome virus TaxID=92652 RepID=A0A2U9GAW0_WSSV|nr:wsv094 [Shrimp white spot syndrome virus]